MQAKGALGRRIGWFRGLASSVFVVSIALPAAAVDLFVDCREGNPSGSPFTSIADAINSTPTSEPRLDVILRSDCVENVTIQRPHVTIAPEWDRCPSSGCTTNGAPARIVAANAGGPVIAVTSPVDVTLIHLSLSGGSVGLSVRGNAYVTAQGVYADRNTGAGVTVDGARLDMAEGSACNNGTDGFSIGGGATVNLGGGASWLQNRPLVISGNGRDGIRMDRSTLALTMGTVIEANQDYGLLTVGSDITFGACCNTEVIVQGNKEGGAFLSEASEISFWSRTTIRDNGPNGIYAEGGSHVTVYETADQGTVTIEGHSEVGVNVTRNSQVSFHGANFVRGNGFARKPWSAGVRVDGTSQAFFEKGIFEAPTQVVDNTGAGILVDLGSGLEAPAVVVQNNSGEGVRVGAGSIAYLGREASLWPNGEGPLRCDDTAQVVTNLFHRTAGCRNVSRLTEPRPPRPVGYK